MGSWLVRTTHCCHKDCTALTAVQGKELGMGIAFVVMHSDCSMMCSPICICSYNMIMTLMLPGQACIALCGKIFSTG